MNLPSIYRWDNTGAPTARGETPSLVDVLQACLVDGYGSQSVSTMTHSTGVVTVTTAAAHNLTSFSRQTIAGANEAGYNGTFIITVTGASAFTYPTTGITDASATGTLTTETAGAGWTMPYVNVGGDVAAFRNDSVAGTGFFLQIDGAGGTNAFTPNVQGYEAMTSESAGTNPFHAAVQVFPTSTLANATARPWILIADDRAVYLFVWHEITVNPSNTQYNASGLFFGDICSWHATDAYAAGLVSHGRFGAFGFLSAATGTVGTKDTGGICMPRKADGSTGSLVPAFIVGGGPGSGTTYVGQVGAPYTSGGTIIISQPYLNEGVAHTYRGVLPGYYSPCHPMAFDQWDQVVVGSNTYLSIRTQGRNASGATYYVNPFISLTDWR